MKTFLVVDDDEDLRYLVGVAVQRWGHRALVAADVSEARRLCAEERPDVLLLDVSMPEVAGPAFLASLREDGLAPPRVYLLSALDRHDLASLAAELDVGFVVKPFTVRTLRADLADVLGGSDPAVEDGQEGGG